MLMSFFYINFFVYTKLEQEVKLFLLNWTYVCALIKIKTIIVLLLKIHFMGISIIAEQAEDEKIKDFYL